jgi:hypothetical protein
MIGTFNPSEGEPVDYVVRHTGSAASRVWHFRLGEVDYQVGAQQPEYGEPARPFLQVHDPDTEAEATRKPTDGEVHTFMGMMEFFKETVVPQIKAQQAEAHATHVKSNPVRWILDRLHR